MLCLFFLFDAAGPGRLPSVLILRCFVEDVALVGRDLVRTYICCPAFVWRISSRGIGFWYGLGRMRKRTFVFHWSLSGRIKGVMFRTGGNMLAIARVMHGLVVVTFKTRLSSKILACCVHPTSHLHLTLQTHRPQRSPGPHP